MKSLVIMLSILLSSSLYAQDNKKNETVVIKTSSECGMCKERIESKLNYTKGIKFVELDVETKNLTVKYSPKVIGLDEIRVLVSQLGYDADEVKADPQAVENLPACCKPGGMKK